MMVLSTMGVLVGTVLGLDFKVLILVPASGIAGALVAAAGIPSGEGGWQIAFAIVAVAISVQLGYLAGTVMRQVFDAARAKYRVSIRPNADSDEGGQLFRLKADSASDRLRTPFR